MREVPPSLPGAEVGRRSVSPTRDEELETLLRLSSKWKVEIQAGEEPGTVEAVVHFPAITEKEAVDSLTAAVLAEAERRGVIPPAPPGPKPRGSIAEVPLGELIPQESAGNIREFWIVHTTPLEAVKDHVVHALRMGSGAMIVSGFLVTSLQDVPGLLEHIRQFRERSAKAAAGPFVSFDAELRRRLNDPNCTCARPDPNVFWPGTCADCKRPIKGAPR